MKSLATLATFLIVIGTIGAIVYFSYDGIIYLYHLYGTLEAATRITLLSVLAVLIICSLIIGNAIKNSTSGTRSSVMIESKLRLYKALVEIYKPVAADGINHSDVKHKLLAKLESIEAELHIVAAGQVLAIHNKLRRTLVQQDLSHSAATTYQQLIIIIRRDLGHNESQLARKNDMSTLQTPSSSLQKAKEKPA